MRKVNNINFYPWLLHTQSIQDHQYMALLRHTAEVIQHSFFKGGQAFPTFSKKIPHTDGAVVGIYDPNNEQSLHPIKQHYCAEDDDSGTGNFIRKIQTANLQQICVLKFSIKKDFFEDTFEDVVKEANKYSIRLDEMKAEKEKKRVRSAITQTAKAP